MRLLYYCAYLLLIFLTILVSCTGSQRLSNPNHPAAADSIINYTAQLLHAGFTTKALTYADDAMTKLHAGRQDLWKKYNLFCHYYLDYGPNPIRGRLYIDSMYQVIGQDSLYYASEYASTLFTSGDLLLAETHYTAAFERYFAARNFAVKQLDSCKIAVLSYRLAMVKYRQRQFPESLLYFKQALRESNKSCVVTETNILQKVSILQDMGSAYQEIKNDNRAIVCYHEALRLMKIRHYSSIAATIRLGELCGNLGDVYLWKHQYDSAFRYLNIDLLINNKLGFNQTHALLSLVDLASWHIRKNELPVAEKLLQQADSTMSQIRSSNWDRMAFWENWYVAKWTYYDMAGKPGPAYYYMHRFYAYTDSLRNAENGLRMADMEQAFDVSRQTYRLTILNRDNRLQKVYLIAIILFLLFSLAIIVVIWLSLKRSHSDNLQINQQNIRLQKALTALEQSQQENTQLLQVVAHDLRNPIGSMFALAGLMLEDTERSQEDTDILRLMRTSGQNALELVGDLLHSHAQTDNLEKESLDIQQLLKYCAELLQSKAKEKTQTIQLAARPLILSINGQKMWRVISNLIGNAIKFSPAGASIWVSLQELPECAVISVKDNGIGIPDDLKAKLFDLFTSAKRTGTAGEQAFGLGLAISKQIVESHGGQIWCEDNPEGGTIFFVKLPR